MTFASPRRFSFRTWDGTTLSAACWEPTMATRPLARERSAIVIVHGMGEHLGRYHSWGLDLADQGHWVWGIDLRGHGQSPGRRGDVPGLHYWVHDILEFCDFVARHLVDARSEPRSRPQLIAHSLGGLLALTAASVAPESIRKLFLISPYFRPAFAPQWWRLAAARSLAEIWPSLTLDVGLRPEQFAHDQAVQRAILEDPACHQKLSVRLALPILAQGENFLRGDRQLAVPCQIVHGGADTITCHRASQQFAEQQPDANLILVPQGAHQIHNDAASRPIVWDCLHRWLD